MQLLDSHIDAGQELPIKDRQAFYTALIEYVAYGIEPNLSGAAKAVFVAIRPTLDNSRARAAAGRSGGSKTEANANQNAKQTRSKPASKTEAKRKQTGKQTRSKSESNANQNADFAGSYQDSSSSSYSYSSGEGVQGEGFSPPTHDEARAYFEANMLRGDPVAFVDHFAAQGWVRGNGLPVGDWMALARQWSAKQREIDTERAARGEGEAEWKPVHVETEAELEAEERAFFDKHGYWPGEG